MSPVLPRLFVALCVILTGVDAMAQKLVIAHRGASAYLPEHTLEAKAMAHAMGADYVEQDVVMTRDDQLVVLHDITLERTTDVARRFPGRTREDGRYYVVDFTLAELRTLRVGEGVRTDGETGRQPVYPDRFPVDTGSFRINTLAEEIELVQGLNRSTGRKVGIYPEIKAPAFHRSEGKDPSTAVLQTLRHYGYTRKLDKVFLQTFDFDELRIIHDELLPALGMDINLVQLMADHPEYQWMLEAEGMMRLARYADGIGPEKGMLVSVQENGRPEVAPLVRLAHENGLLVHPYTFRADAGQVPSFAADFDGLLSFYFDDVGVDGLFTDFPDRAVDVLDSR